MREIDVHDVARPLLGSANPSPYLCKPRLVLKTLPGMSPCRARTSFATAASSGMAF
jgi:hypothetical protein